MLSWHFFNVKIKNFIIILMILTLPFATCAISIHDVTAGVKTRRVFQDRD